MSLEWITNEYDPRREDARMRFPASPDEDKDKEWAEYQKWLKDKIISKPRAGAKHTVAQLEAMGVVGIYRVRSS